MKKCTVCGQKTASLYRNYVRSVYSARPYSLLRCSNCQHFFTFPTPSLHELDDIYTNKYSYDAHALIEKEKIMRAKRYAKQIASLPGATNVLEVGCMHGILLIELQKRDLKASGVELDPEAVAKCRAQGLNVVQASIEDHLKKAQGSNDVVIMSHVLEHIVDPRKQLEGLAKRMPPKGNLVLIVPNSLARSRMLFGRFWGYWQVPVHINHFNKYSIAKLLEKTGFSLSEVKYYGADSLFFLSSLANMLGASNDSKQLSTPKKLLVKIATLILRPWYYIGKEDMLVIAKRG